MTEAMIIDQVTRLVEGKCTYETQMLLELRRIVKEKNAEGIAAKINENKMNAQTYR